VSVRGSASRYAKALLDVAITESSAAQAEQDLKRFIDLFEQYPDLKKALMNPAVPVTGKRSVMQELVKRLELSRPVARLLLMLADRDRLILLPDLVEVYRERLLDYEQIVRAEVITATPLEPSRAERLQRRLAEVTGRRVTMSARVDPSIIGGVIARIGSVVYDGSVATQLAKIRDRLVQQG
jgi:F-type H+-transporting ATPase subunit delta